MFSLYLPIAEMSIDAVVLIALGFVVGVISGILGLGGGFILTPILIFLGIPPAVAVASGANQIVATSVSGVTRQWQKNNVDIKMGIYVTLGGLLGSSGGVWLFRWLQTAGQLDVIVRLTYVILLGVMGGLMLRESMRFLAPRLSLNQANQLTPRQSFHRHRFFNLLPFKTRFRRSGLYLSALIPLAIGVVIGIITAIMGVGGGFLLVPAMVYILGMPTLLVVGTSLFQVVFVTANTTFWQAWLNQTVDVSLSLCLLVGGVIGSQYGNKFASKWRAEHIRLAMSFLILSLAVTLLFTLLWPASEPYSLQELPPTHGL